MVIEQVEDLDWATVGKLPGGGVHLPGLVGQLGFEADKGRARPLMGLRSDQAVALEQSPYGCDRGRLGELTTQEMGDGLWPSVVTGGDELIAKGQDSGLDFS